MSDPIRFYYQGKLHEVSVRVTSGGLKTRAKKNYVAPKG